MTTSKELATRLKEVILDGTWIANTNFRDQLSGTSWTLANTQVGSLNSIGLLTQHIHYYIKGIKEALLSGELCIRDRYSFNFEPLQSQEEWEAVQSRLWVDTESLIEIIEGFTPDALRNHFIDKKYGSLARNIDGMIEHSYYHLGQVSLLKKLILTEDNTSS